MKSYNKKLNDFNNRKLKLLIHKTNNNETALRYFVKEDVEFINNLNPIFAKLIWNRLCNNIKEDYYGISRETCAFCILTLLSFSNCNTCSWGKYHGRCSSEDGDFRRLQKFFSKHNIETISSEEYKKIISCVG